MKRQGAVMGENDLYSIRCDSCGTAVYDGEMAFDINGDFYCGDCAVKWLYRELSFTVEADEEYRQKIYACGISD